MPELPEVQTTVSGLQKVLPKLSITDVWTDLSSSHKMHIESIKNAKYFENFKKEIVGKKVVSVSRRGKNILINFSDVTVLVHMKMTGHLLYGNYEYNAKKNSWTATEKGPLRDDPFNRFVHAVFSLSNKKQLAFSDARKFGKIGFASSLSHLGPEPLNDEFTEKVLKEVLQKKPNGKIKTTLMDQEIIAGIGNIYSDEILWTVGIHPEERVKNITDAQFKKMLRAIKELLSKGIDFGGDSTSDYRNIEGVRGKFQAHHHAYRMTGKPCARKNCTGVILRKVVGGRSAHFCSVHQTLEHITH